MRRPSRVVALALPVLALLAVALVAGRAEARERSVKWPGPFAVDLVSVRDGDSVAVVVRGRCPFGCERAGGRSRITIRLGGVDAPETRRCGARPSPSCAACEDERRAGLAAKARLIELVDGRALRVAALKPDKYRGRVVGDLQALTDGAWRSAGATLLGEGHVVPYDGGAKAKPWCAR